MLNGVEFDHNGKVHPLEATYPGSNLFSLASGGASRQSFLPARSDVSSMRPPTGEEPDPEV